MTLSQKEDYINAMVAGDDPKAKLKVEGIVNFLESVRPSLTEEDRERERIDERVRDGEKARLTGLTGNGKNGGLGSAFDPPFHLKQYRSPVLSKGKNSKIEVAFDLDVALDEFAFPLDPHVCNSPEVCILVSASCSGYWKRVCFKYAYLCN